MPEEYRLGFNYDGIIKLVYRVIIGFFAFRFGYYIHTHFQKWADWIMSMDGVDASAIKDIHLTITSALLVILGTIIAYRVLLNIVKKYIITRKLKKTKDSSDLAPRNSISKEYEGRY